MFDFQFKRFITLKLVSVLYILGLLGIVAGVGLQILTTYKMEALSGYSTATLIGGAIVSAIALRVSLELTVVLFRIAENTGGSGQRS